MILQEAAPEVSPVDARSTRRESNGYFEPPSDQASSWRCHRLRLALSKGRARRLRIVDCARQHGRRGPIPRTLTDAHNSLTWTPTRRSSLCRFGSLTGQERTPIVAIAHLWAALPTQLGRSSTSSTRSLGQLAARVSWGAIITGLTRIAMSGWKCTVVPVVPSSATGVRSVVGSPCSYR